MGGRDGELAVVLAAMADTTRRALLDELARGEASATGLAERVPVTRQAVVKHLGVLERAGLVTARRDGREVLFSIRPEPLSEAADWLRRRAADWDSRLDAIRAVKEAEEPVPQGKP